MKLQAYMSGQITGQVPSQPNQQLSGLSEPNSGYLPSQLPHPGAPIMDQELLQSRNMMREKIYQCLQRKNFVSVEWLPRVPELARRLEEVVFRNAASKEEYMKIVREPIEHRLQSIIRNSNNHNQPLHHHISPSSSISTMIPTPGIVHNGTANSMVSCPVDNSMHTTTGVGMGTSTAVNSGSLLPTASGSATVGQNRCFGASDRAVPTEYQKLPANSAPGSGGNRMMSAMGLVAQSSHVIPTPGLNNVQSVAVNSQFSNGGGFSNIESTRALHEQKQMQRHYIGSENIRILHGLGGQISSVMRPNIQQKTSTYMLSNGLMNAGVGLIGNNAQLVNGPSTSEGYLSMASYGSSQKHSLQHFDQQHHQQTLPTSLSQQILPKVGDGYAVNNIDLSDSGSIYGAASSVVTAVNDTNMNITSLHSKSNTKTAILTHHANLQSMQQSTHIKSEMSDHSQKVNFDAPQSSHEHPSQQQMQNLQHQQFQQHPNQPYGEFPQCEHQQQDQQHNQQLQQLMLKTDNLREPLISSHHGGQLVLEHGDGSKESFVPQATKQLHLSEINSQYRQINSVDSHARSAQLLSPSGLQDHHASFSSSSGQMLYSNQHAVACKNDFSCFSSGSQSESLSQGQWLSQPPQNPQMPDSESLDHHIQDELQKRIRGQDEAQRPHFSLEGCITSHASTMRSIAVPPSSVGVMAREPGNSTCERNYFDQMRWLLFLLHARECKAMEGECPAVNCTKARQLVMHIDKCKGNQCGYPRCGPSRRLLEHFRSCRAADCPVCVRLRNFVVSNRRERVCPPDTGLANQTNSSWRAVNGAFIDKKMLPVETSDDEQLFSKRMKVQHVSPSLVLKVETSPDSVPAIDQTNVSQEIQAHGCQQINMTVPVRPEVSEVKINPCVDSKENPAICGDIIYGNLGNAHNARADVELAVPIDTDGHIKGENMVEKEIDQDKIEVKQEADLPCGDPGAGSKSGKPKIKGVSLTELFTPEQIREHIVSLRQWVGQSKAKAEKNQAMEHSMSENSCQLCAVEKLTFEPPPIYCSPCGARIKRNAMYYTIGSGETRHYFCIPCYNEARGDSVEVDGTTFQKAKLEKKKNDEETEEWWVQCDKCEAWQHQICALFNGRRNDGGQAEYTCPNCYIAEIKRGERKPLPQSAVLGAKDLPRTILSDHIEQRLFRRLKQERQERARQLGKIVDEVPGAEALVVRVVSSVDKKLEVKQRFLEIFQEENYPTEFPYKSKVILLFQKIEGVEVCLFGMYVQEFGSECPFPNQRRVYLSYLDSVKYFRPDIKTVNGEALRTFVYHEILIGYLEYCKKRGFTSCYIWACPPLKGEDYILYCHPEIQKTPKSDKLREWYLSMLRKAAKESIVVDLTNLYDHFFVTMDECKAKVTAARLPYFDGDYWPGAAEDMINQLQQEEDGRKQQKKGKTKKIITKRALKAAGQTDLAGNASKNALLMQKLGETICPMKEDFIMVHLQHACSHCCLLMVSGTRWVCNQCKNFQLCEKCNGAEQRLDDRDRHPINSREKHLLHPVEIDDVPSDTKDKDEILESEFFDTRQAFLSLCQGNHYQYDTLRRAKHSSMMVLYHLHNPTAPAFVTTCYICHHDIETGQGWRCEICPDFDVCNACYQKGGGIDHPHKLTNHPSMADRDAQNKEARQKRVLQLRKMLDLLVHASQCRFPHCQYPNCRKVKGLFRHGIQCKIRASGGCVLCKKMWYLLQLHARACKESECHVPRCKDLKEHLRRLQQQSDSRRRAAVMEMMRQRAAEVAGNAG